jgi:hypothetical protein
MRILPCEVFMFILATDILHEVKFYDMGPPALLPFRRRAADLIALGWV